MTAAFLTPTLALAYLRELSVDVRAAVVLDAAGELLAGDAELVERVREQGSPEDAELLVARTPSGLAIAVMPGPCALRPLLQHDLERVAADLAEAGFPRIEKKT
jgi:hypothetical protein